MHNYLNNLAIQRSIGLLLTLVVLTHFYTIYFTHLFPFPIYIGIVLVSLLFLQVKRHLSFLIMGIIYLSAWFFLRLYPGMWTFEFLFPALFALCISFSETNSPWISPSLYKQFSLFWLSTVTIIFFIAIFLGYTSVIAFTEAKLRYQVATYSVITFIALSCLQLILDRFISVPKPPKTAVKYNFPWIDIMVIIIGAMMVMQVYANIFSGLYEVKNYADLVQYYAAATGAHFLKPLLLWSAEHAKILSPLQFIFEAVIAITLSLLIFPSLSLIASGLLFGFLALVELGVSATWPADPTNLTWQWELLLVTGVSLIIGIGRLVEAWQLKSWRYALLGARFFNHSLGFKLLLACLSALALYGACMLTQVFGSPYKIISLCTGISFFLLMLLHIYLDRFRYPSAQ